jgi:NitT/TauT family transport system substrate-binding protein
MQQNQKGYESIVVWNPFVMETLKKRKDSKVLFDSTSIPGEIVDMVVISKKAYKKDGGDRFASAVIDAFYAVNERIKNPDTKNDTLIALGEKFSHLNLKAMKKIVEQTKFYKTPEDGIALYNDPIFQKVMKKVVTFCVDHEVIGRIPSIDYNDDKGKFDLVFTKEPMERVLELQKEVQIDNKKEVKTDEVVEEVPETIKGK